LFLTSSYKYLSYIYNENKLTNSKSYRYKGYTGIRPKLCLTCSSLEVA